MAVFFFLISCTFYDSPRDGWVADLIVRMIRKIDRLVGWMDRLE